MSLTGCKERCLSLQKSRANPKLGAQIERTEIAVIRNKQAINTIAREI